jgi:hypothetical protein
MCRTEVGPFQIDNQDVRVPVLALPSDVPLTLTNIVSLDAATSSTICAALGAMNVRTPNMEATPQTPVPLKFIPTIFPALTESFNASGQWNDPSDRLFKAADNWHNWSVELKIHLGMCSFGDHVDIPGMATYSFRPALSTPPTIQEQVDQATWDMNDKMAKACVLFAIACEEHVYVNIPSC